MVQKVKKLIRVDDPAWPEIEQLVRSSSNDVRVLPCQSADGENTLYRLQMTAHSMLGGIVLNCGAMTVDHGWVKVLGAGVPGLPGVATANGFPDQPGSTPPALPGMIVAVDVMGGQFAIDGGGLGNNPGEVCYWDPSSLSWIGLGAGHSAFVRWLFTTDHTDFYQDLRWDGWEAATTTVDISQGISAFPYPWTKEYHTGAVSRRAVPLQEVLGVNRATAEQLGPDLPLPLYF